MMPERGAVTWRPRSQSVDFPLQPVYGRTGFPERPKLRSIHVWLSLFRLADGPVGSAEDYFTRVAGAGIPRFLMQERHLDFRVSRDTLFLVPSTTATPRFSESRLS